jgi:glutaryl-CoA dehydrogenase
MEKIWTDFTAKVQGAFADLQKRHKKDLGLLGNLPEIMAYLKDMTSEDLLLLLDQARKIKKRKHPELPPIDPDFYATQALLSDAEAAVLAEVRDYLTREVEPIVTEAWLKGDFPFEIVAGLRALDICGLNYPGCGARQGSRLLEGKIAELIASVDVSVCTFFGAHSGLAMGSVFHCGSDAQKAELLPKMQKLELIGAFALTEPEVGSAASTSLRTTCRRDGDTWTINGQKKWIGNATFADLIVVWAKDEADHHVKGFLVEKGTPGLSTEKIEDKMSLRIVQNAIVTLEDCKIKEEKRLQNANTFKDTAKVLRQTRAGVAWQAVGCSRGAYENTLHYAQRRRQFGRPIGGFQMTQDLLAQMLSQLTAMQRLMTRLSQLQDQGTMSEEQASLAKVFCTVSCRQITSMARELMGANGILLGNKVARFLADAEALYSYEGTKQINSLIVGRAITGQSAFV